MVTPLCYHVAMKVTDGTELLTLKEAAARIGVSPITLQQQIRKGALPAIRLGNQWVVTADDLRIYTETRQGKRGFASPTHPYHGLRPLRRGDDAAQNGAGEGGTDGTHTKQEAEAVVGAGDGDADRALHRTLSRSC